MAKGWYIIHTYAGYENRIEKKLHGFLEAGLLPSNVLFNVEVPEEQTVEVKDGKKKYVNRKFLPSYIMLEMELGDDWKGVCAAIRGIEGVTGFVGTHSRMDKPRPITDDEAKNLLQKSGEIKGDRSARVKQAFAAGDQVKIIEGAFATFTGTVDEVNMEKNKLRVIVGIFGRPTTVELEMLQVEKA
jgi:transcriptional antiterminator NusG